MSAKVTKNPVRRSPAKVIKNTLSPMIFTDDDKVSLDGRLLLVMDIWNFLLKTTESEKLITKMTTRVVETKDLEPIGMKMYDEHIPLFKRSGKKYIHQLGVEFMTF